MSKLKKVLLGLAVLLVTIQFFHGKKNISTATPVNGIASVFTTPEEIQIILAKSCNDCHSNNTIYPWYNNIQPIGFWLGHHVNEGKEELNFDEFANYSLRKQYHKLEETEEMIIENEMPLFSYTLTHKDAVLDERQKQLLIDWTKSIRKQMEANYPIDSLIRPKKN